MDAPQKAGQVVFTNRARCRDCYRCLRACPVKAIRMHKGQAFVVWERCISCGTCIRECPQHAKTFRRDVERAARLIASGAKTAASIAPSFAAAFSEWEQKRLPAALRRLGFRHVAETSIGAFAVAQETANVVNAHDGRPHVCTACPAVVSYVERYHPDLVSSLVPVVSPMTAHGRHIKHMLGPDTKVVFIGPCVAKKEELAREEAAGAVECVLTFAELRDWLEEQQIDLSQCEESDFDEKPAGDARYFPLPGGLARTAALHTDYLDLDCIPVSGVEDLRQALDSVRRTRRGVLVEPLFCAQGCVNGPGIGADSNVFDRRGEVIEYAEANPGVCTNARPPADLRACFSALPIEPLQPFSEEDIASVLRRTGKANPDDQLNCGACGYSSCREKAIAVLQGMAEPEMCIPYMRRLAEQRTDRIIETSPNGIVLLDERLNLLGMNPAFKNFFMCSDAVLGKPISYLMDPALFEQLLHGEKELIETTVRHEKYNLICHQLLYALREERQFVGIFVNITRSQASEKQLERLRSDTVRQAKDLMEHQVLVAQQMAQFLGESTARSEELVRNLINLATEKPKTPGDHWM